MKYEEVVCAFCGGQGRDQFGIMSWLSRCVVCGGRGVVVVPIPHQPCRHCRGTGAIKTFPCTVCGGKGSIEAPRGPSAPCPACEGRGDDASVPAMPCLNCRGRGWTPLASPGA